MKALRHSLRPGDAGWPCALDDLSDPPEQLRVEGSLPTHGDAVAIVGTRCADEDAVRFARELGGALGGAGFSVVSGGARGVDTAAHEGALEAGAETVAVLGGGLDCTYPAANRGLFQRVAHRGALVSEYDDGCHPKPGRFLKRNRILAALTKLVVVVQAPARSGALSTAAHAFRLGRPVMAVPAAPWDPRGAGSLDLLVRGARVCRSAADVLNALGSVRNPVLPGFPRDVAEEKHEETRPRDPATPETVGFLANDQRRVLQVLGARPCHPDEISRLAGVAVARALEVLLELELQGLVKARIGGGYVRKPHRT